MQILVLDQTRLRVFGAIDQLHLLGQGCLKSQFLSQTPHSRPGRRFACSGMPTTTIRPESREVVLAVRAPLQKNFIPCIENKDRKGPVKQTLPVYLKLITLSQRAIVAIHQNHTLQGILLSSRSVWFTV